MTVDDRRSGGGDSNFKSGPMRTRAADLGMKGLTSNEIGI